MFKTGREVSNPPVSFLLTGSYSQMDNTLRLHCRPCLLLLLLGLITHICGNTVIHTVSICIWTNHNGHSTLHNPYDRQCSPLIVNVKPLWFLGIHFNKKALFLQYKKDTSILQRSQWSDYCFVQRKSAQIGQKNYYAHIEITANTLLVYLAYRFIKHPHNTSPN